MYLIGKQNSLYKARGGCANRLIWHQIIVLLSLLLFFPDLTHAAKHALLIGVSKYQNLSKDKQLKGPVNDVKLLLQFLQQRNFERKQITVLADGVQNAQLPTRKNILRELDLLTNRVNRGDFVFIYFSGHGSQQPANPKSLVYETDGLDEIILPADVGKWDGQKGTVQNAIVDDEINAVLLKLRQRGASVWAVFDSCHSGTLVRAETSHLIPRFVSPLLLGIPSKKLAQSQQTKITTRGSYRESNVLDRPLETNPIGDLVVFYASHADELTYEVSLTGTQTKDSYGGIFTFYLLQALESNPGLTYRQVGEQILFLYAAKNLNRPTPLFDGTALDNTILNAQPEVIVRQWKINKRGGRLTIPAGHLHQLSVGSILSIVPSPASQEITGYAKISQSGLFGSQLKPVKYQGKAALIRDNINRDAYARLIYNPPILNLKIALPLPVKQPTIKSKKISKVIEQIRKSDSFHFRWLPAGIAADIHLKINHGKLWLLPPTTDWINNDTRNSNAINLSLSEEVLTQQLINYFSRFSKSLNLARLNNQFKQSTLSNMFQVKASIITGNSQVEVFYKERVPHLNKGNQIQFEMINNANSPVDVTMLFVDSKQDIHVFFPCFDRGISNRIAANVKFKLPINIGDDSLGFESAYFIAVKSRKNSPVSDFSYLANKGSPKECGQIRGQPFADDDIKQMQGIFGQAGFSVTQRSGTSKERNLKSFDPDARFVNRFAIKGFRWVVE